jgi:hypothetical protein
MNMAFLAPFPMAESAWAIEWPQANREREAVQWRTRAENRIQAARRRRPGCAPGIVSRSCPVQCVQVASRLAGAVSVKAHVVLLNCAASLIAAVYNRQPPRSQSRRRR